jgi:hypothetical protein
MILKLLTFLRRYLGMERIEDDYEKKSKSPKAMSAPAQKKPVSGKVSPKTGSHQQKTTSSVSSGRKNSNATTVNTRSRKSGTHIQPKNDQQSLKSNNQKNTSAIPVTPRPPAQVQTAVQQNTDKAINKSMLMRRIKTNIFFLDDLMGKLEGIEKYRKYYIKVRDLKTQSEGTFKIIHRISEDAPYYYNTLKAILEHTRTIEKLFKSDKNK